MHIKWFRTQEPGKTNATYYLHGKAKDTYTDAHLYDKVSKLSGFFLINTHSVHSLKLNSKKGLFYFVLISIAIYEIINEIKSRYFAGRDAYENDILAKFVPKVHVTWKKVTINKKDV